MNRNIIKVKEGLIYEEILRERNIYIVWLRMSEKGVWWSLSASHVAHWGRAGSTCNAEVSNWEGRNAIKTVWFLNCISNLGHLYWWSVESCRSHATDFFPLLFHVAKRLCLRKSSWKKALMISWGVAATQEVERKLELTANDRMMWSALLKQFWKEHEH